MSNATIEDQTRRALDNISAIVAADRLTMEHVVSTTVYLTDINEFGRMNRVYATYFKSAPPPAHCSSCPLSARPKDSDFDYCRRSVILKSRSLRRATVRARVSGERRDDLLRERHRCRLKVSGEVLPVKNWRMGSASVMPSPLTARTRLDSISQIQVDGCGHKRANIPL
jgi:hypothetical protein